MIYRYGPCCHTGCAGDCCYCHWLVALVDRAEMSDDVVVFRAGVLTQTAIGPKLMCQLLGPMSALGSNADMPQTLAFGR